MAKISELTMSALAEYCRCDANDALLGICFESAKNYICNQTGLTLTECDAHADLTIACMLYTADMYDNRSNSETNGNCNRIVDAIVSHHRKNLI